ncbi:transporter substrate-binding domain-containing protein [Allohahella marinimesophila]|uniref:Solute-binding protein family 3/N-terminal domain-containing protein n=1 Tax=Allohahella marinimesophila TaxID=1054972 RepID=A0ABP7Q231_9GAMM
MAASEPPLTLGFVEFPPASYVDDAGQPAGHLLDLGQRALERAGYRWKAKHYPANRLAAYLGTGDVDLFLGITTIPGFKGNILAGEMTIARIELRAYSKGEAPAVQRWEDLQGKIVIVLRGYSYGGWINRIKDPSTGISALEVDDHAQALKVLNLGRGDILLDYAGPVDAALKQVEVPDLHSTLISLLECKFIVSRKTPRAKRLLRDLEAAFVSLRESEAVF